MPTQRLGEADRDYAIAAAIPVDHPGLTYVLGRQSCDTRALEGGSIDVGNARYGGQEAMIIIDDVFIPNEHIFMDGEVEYAAPLVERFTAFHRRSYVCKTGLGDVLIGAAAQLADYNGVAGASHINDKLVEMAHLNETMYGAGIASSHESQPAAGGQLPEQLAAGQRLQAQRDPVPVRAGPPGAGHRRRTGGDPAGRGRLRTTRRSARCWRSTSAPARTCPTEHRVRMLRLVENLTMGRNAVGYLTESLHGAGSPQAQRVQIAREADFEADKALARRLAGIDAVLTRPGGHSVMVSCAPLVCRSFSSGIRRAQ